MNFQIFIIFQIVKAEYSCEDVVSLSSCVNFLITYYHVFLRRLAQWQLTPYG